MNGRKAKALRRRALDKSVGLPGRIYDMPHRKPNGHLQRTVELGRCTRRVYQGLKKEYR